MRRLLYLLPPLLALLLSFGARALDDVQLAVPAAQYLQSIREGRDAAGQPAAALLQQAEQQARQKNWTAAIAAYETAIAAGADTVVLGCTHYHFLAEDVAAEFPGVATVETSEAVARRAVTVLAEQSLEAPPGQPGGLDLIVSGDREAFKAVMTHLGFAPHPAEVLP